MKTRTKSSVLICAALGAASLAAPGHLRGQAPPGPIRPAQPLPQARAPSEPKERQPKQPQGKLTLAGSWKLNRDESDDPRKKMQEARGADRGGGGPYGGGRRGGGYPGGGRGPYGGRRRGTSSGENSADRERIQAVFRPADSLTFALKGAEIDLSDDQNRKWIFYTDGRKLQKPKDDQPVELAAHWEQDRLVAEEKGPRGGKIVRSFEIDPEAQQLREVVKWNHSRSNPLVIIRYIYDIARENKP